MGLSIGVRVLLVRGWGGRHLFLILPIFSPSHYLSSYHTLPLTSYLFSGRGVLRTLGHLKATCGGRGILHPPWRFQFRDDEMEFLSEFPIGDSQEGDVI